MKWKIQFVGLWLAIGLPGAGAAEGQVPPKTYALPVGEPASEEYSVKVNGTPVPVHVCRVSAVPFNQVWPGYQRPLDQTELAAFASWDATGPVTVEVTSRRLAKSVAVRPSSRGVVPVVADGRITFHLPGPGQFTVELDGPRQALHLFYNPPEKEIPDRAAPNVRYFGPGVHRVGEIVLTNNQTIYIAGGAVVHGFIRGDKVRNVRILGRGILDGSEFDRDKKRGNIRLYLCEDIVIDGVILRDPNEWCLSLWGCRRAVINNVKLIGLWRYNADGIDLVNCENVVVRDCFVRAFDDGIVIKGKKPANTLPVRNIKVERCVVWCDWGRALEIGAETSAPEFTGVLFENCDIIRTTHIALDIQHGDRATIRDIVFRDIRVEVDEFNLPPQMQTSPEHKYTFPPDDKYLPQLLVIVIKKNYYSADKEAGIVRDIKFQNIRVTGKRLPASRIGGLDADHDVRGVTIENLQFNGRRLTTPADAKLEIQPFATVELR